MTRDQILRTLAEHRHEIAGHSVKRLAVFGSVARDEAGSDSDIDVLVEFEGPATFDRYMDLKFFLEDLVGRSVDLVTRKALKPSVMARVEKEALDVA